MPPNFKAIICLIPKETIDKIFDASRIDEVVGDFLPLKKRGVNLLGLCPFHNEKTPSFTVSPAKGIYKCFGCGEAGNSINFVMKHENYTYPEALRYLAAKYGIEVKEKEQTDEGKRIEVERESMMGVTAFAQKYFSENLKNHSEGIAIGLQYFNERGFNDFIIEKFQLGYAIDSFDALQSEAKAKGYSEDVLIRTGLLVKTEEGKVYDRFRGRVIFPINNISGRTIGFGGRILDSSKSKAKYVNSPESEIYHKSDVLYGIHLARTAIMKAENCFLVEGYTDVISMHIAGVENVVASSGTSLTTGQIKLLKRYTNKVTILYDGDAAGIKASFRGMDMIIEEGLNVKIVLFPDGEDPDSFARKHSAEDVSKFITEKAKDFILFKSDILSEEAGNDPAKKAAMIKDIVQSISLVPENIDRLLYTREASQIVNIDEQLLINEVNKYRRNKLYKDNKYVSTEIIEPAENISKPQIILEESNAYNEKELVRVLLNYGDMKFCPKHSGLSLNIDSNSDETIGVALFIVGSLLVDEMRFEEDEILKKIFSEYQEAIEQDNIPSQKYFVNHTDEEIRRSAIDLITLNYQLSENWEKMHKIFVTLENDNKVLARLVISAVYAFKLKYLNKKIEELNNKLKDNELEAIAIENIQRQAMSFTTSRNKMASDLGRIILK